MKKRDALLALLALGAAPFTARAQQQSKVWRVGFLSVGRPLASVNADPRYKAFRESLRDLGYVEGKNLMIEWRFGEGNIDRLNNLAVELVRMKVDVIVTSAQGTFVAQNATASIPIVSASMGGVDPVALGLAASLARPGGNITGLANYTGDFVAKFVELLMSVAPKVSRVAVLVNPDQPSSLGYLKSVQTAAQKSNLTLVPMNAHTPQEIQQSFAAMKRERVAGLIILPDGFYLLQVRQLAELAIRLRIPSIWGGRQFPDVGGLMSYGVGNGVENHRRLAKFVDKILKGAKAGDLPIELPTKFELVINRKTAKALGITIPQQLLLQATEVIE